MDTRLSPEQDALRRTAGDRYLVISADTHAGADVEDYRPYLATSWHDEFDRWAASYVNPFDDLVDEAAVCNWDSDLRRRQLEADGIVAEVVFPNTIPPFLSDMAAASTLPTGGAEYERRWAGLQAHNRWLVDFCGELPGRRRGVAQIWPVDIDDAVAEIEWAAARPEIGGVLLASVPPNSVEPLYSDRYDPMWRACVDGGLTVATHAGTGAPDLPADDPATMPVLVFEYAFWSHRTLWHLLFGGVFHRFPELRFAMTEQGACAWLAGVMDGLDAKADTIVDPAKRTAPADPELLARLSRLPSEVIRANCYLGASFMQAHDAPLRHAVGVDHVMWGADYPHREGTTPFTREALRHTFAAVPVDETALMLGGVAAEVYGFDVDALRPIADEFGPLVSEVHTPLDRVPAESTSYAFFPEYKLAY